MIAMILAAGHGERMRNLTENQPKPMIEIDGKPLIAYQIDSLISAGVEKIVINIGRFGDQIRDYLGSGEDKNIAINYSNEGMNPLETAGGVVKALSLIGENEFILTNADIYTDFNYKLLPTQLDSDDAHIVLVSNPKHNLKGDFALEHGRILDSDTEKLTYSGIGYYHPRFFKKYMPKKNRYPLAPLLHQAVKENKLSGQHFDGYWNDIGTPERLNKIRKEINSKY